MWLRDPLDDILSSRAKVAVLRVVCCAAMPLNGREIARRAGLSSGHASRVLGELTASGVLLARDQGRVLTYELALAHGPLVARIKSLFEDEAARQEAALDELEVAVPGLVSIVLFGSEARGDARPGSDTDLLIVIEEYKEDTRARVREAALAVAQRHGLALSWHIADLAELREWQETGFGLWRGLVAEGVTLRGTPLRRLVRQWQHGKTA